MVVGGEEDSDIIIGQEGKGNDGMWEEEELVDCSRFGFWNGGLGCCNCEGSLWRLVEACGGWLKRLLKTKKPRRQGDLVT